MTGNSANIYPVFGHSTPTFNFILYISNRSNWSGKNVILGLQVAIAYFALSEFHTTNSVLEHTYFSFYRIKRLQFVKKFYVQVIAKQLKIRK